VCTELRLRRQSNAVTTTNPIYRCEELERRDSVYDEIQDNFYNQLHHDQKDAAVYLEVLSDESDGCDQSSTREPQLTDPEPDTEPQEQNTRHSPRPVTNSQDQNTGEGEGYNTREGSEAFGRRQ